jgi:hypothetical protein
MCLDVRNCHWADYYRKHQTPPRLRDATTGDIDLETEEGRPSLYYPSVAQLEVEESVLTQGFYVRSAKRATICKVREFGDLLGASEGQPSRWVLVEVTNGEFHGRPITRELYLKKMRFQTQCCEED